MKIDQGMRYGVSELFVSDVTRPGIEAKFKLMAAAKVKKQPRGVCLVSHFKKYPLGNSLTSDHKSLGESPHQ